MSLDHHGLRIVIRADFRDWQKRLRRMERRVVWLSWTWRIYVAVGWVRLRLSQGLLWLSEKVAPREIR